MDKVSGCSNKEGWVYLVHALQTNRYKIGRTSDLAKRQSQLTKQSPYPLSMLDSFFTLDAVADEKKIHFDLSEYRVFGEWFELEPELVCKKLYICNGGKSRFWWLSDTLFEEIDNQLDKLCKPDWKEKRRLIREELMILTERTLSIGNKQDFYYVLNYLLPRSLNKCYFYDYKWITGNQMSIYEYILGVLVGMNLTLKTNN